MGICGVVAMASSWVVSCVKDSGSSYSSTKEFMVVMFVCEGRVGRGECRLLSSLALLLCVFGRSFFSGVSAIEVGDKFWGMFQMLHGFPGTVTCGKTFPLNYVVEFAPSALSADFLYFFGFVLLFSIDKVRWRSGKVRTVQRRLLIWCQECYDHALLVTGYDVLLSTLQGNLSFSTSSASSFASTHAGPDLSSSLTSRLRHHALSDS